jgi:hypothetical protein
VLGFSLRLGTNTTHCYVLDKPQLLPVLMETSLPVRESFHNQHNIPSVLKFDWTNSDLDFGYPLEVSSSIYRLKDIRPVINILPFQNPNFLESRLSKQAYRFRVNKPYLLCYDKSATFCNPVNKVQVIHQNRVGLNRNYSIEELTRKFEIGERVKVTQYSGFVPTGCHQEVDMVFESMV